MKAQEILNKAAGHMKDRAATYDSPEGERSMGKTVEMFNTLYGTSLTEEQGWAFATILKMVRSSQGKYRADNYEDGAAYFSLMGESASKKGEEDVLEPPTLELPTLKPWDNYTFEAHRHKVKEAIEVYKHQIAEYNKHITEWAKNLSQEK